MGGRGAGLGGKSAISITFKDGKTSMFRINNAGVLLENGRPSSLKHLLSNWKGMLKVMGWSSKLITINN